MKFFEIKTYDVEINAKNRTPDSVRTAIENICDYEPRTIAKYADENEAEKAWAEITPDVLSLASAPVPFWSGKVYELDAVEYDEVGDYVDEEYITAIFPVLPAEED